MIIGEAIGGVGGLAFPAAVGSDAGLPLIGSSGRGAVG